MKGTKDKFVVADVTVMSQDEIWLACYIASLNGYASANSHPDSNTRRDEMAHYAAGIADHALVEYNKRWRVSGKGS